MTFSQVELFRIENRTKAFDSDENMKTFWNDIGKSIWNNVLQNMNEKYHNFREGALKSVMHEPLKEQAEMFMKNPHLMSGKHITFNHNK
jgi:hypothetical protein